MKLLLTGCEGKIGHSLVQKRLTDNHQIRGFDLAGESGADIEYQQGDVRDETSILRAV